PCARRWPTISPASASSTSIPETPRTKAPTRRSRSPPRRDDGEARLRLAVVGGQWWSTGDLRSGSGTATLLLPRGPRPIDLIQFWERFGLGRRVSIARAVDLIGFDVGADRAFAPSV